MRQNLYAAWSAAWPQNPFVRQSDSRTADLCRVAEMLAETVASCSARSGCCSQQDYCWKCPRLTWLSPQKGTFRSSVVSALFWLNFSCRYVAKNSASLLPNERDGTKSLTCTIDDTWLMARQV